MKPANTWLKLPASPVTVLAKAYGESDADPGTAWSASDLAAAYPGR